MSSKNTDEERVLHSSSNNIKFTINDKTDEVIEDFIQSLLCQYHSGLEKSMEGSNFILIMLIFFITYIIKELSNETDHV